MTYLTYDPEVLQKFAQGLYSRARTVVIVYVLIGMIVGLPIGVPVGAVFATAFGSQHDLISTLIGAAAGAGVVGILGGMVGQSRAFILKIQAQTALCQMAIEENTRPRR
jgi:hypothetical protein